MSLVGVPFFWDASLVNSHNLINRSESCVVVCQIVTKSRASRPRGGPVVVSENRGRGIERLRAQRRKLEAELSSVNAQIAEAEEA